MLLSEPDLVPLPGGVDDVLLVEVEEEAAHVLVVHFTSPICLVLANYLEINIVSVF